MVNNVQLKSFGIFLAATLLLACSQTQAATSSPTASRVLVVYNANWTGDDDHDGVQDSIEVANYYMAKRGVPAANILGLACSIGRSSQYSPFINLPYPTFFNDVIAPIKSKLATLGTSNIDIILFCYGVPYQLPTGASLDNAVMALNYLNPTSDNTNAAVSQYPYYNNSYFATSPTFQTDVGHFDHNSFKDPGGNDMYLVSRLDGPRGVQGAMELVDQALYGERYVSPLTGYYNGIAYVESNEGQPNGALYTDAFLAVDLDVIEGNYYSYATADKNIAYAEHYVTQSGFPLKWDNQNLGSYTDRIGDPGAMFSDGTAALLAPRALFYAGWYNYGHYNDVWSWLPGSVACDLNSDSLGGYSIRNYLAGPTFGASALQNGATCVSGVVNEPYLTGHQRPNVLLYYMLKDYTFAEASTLATPNTAGWMAINIGDPLYAPMKAKTLVKDTQSPAFASGFPNDTPGSSPSERTINIIVSDSPEPEVAQVKIEYGLSTSYGSTVLSGEGFWRRHTFLLSNLTPSSVYHYRVTLTDPAGNVTITGDLTFSTAIFVLGGFETPNVGPPNYWHSYLFNPPGAGWTFVGQSGISANQTSFTGSNPDAPEGVQVAILENTGSFSQSFGGFQDGTSYTFVFAAAQRGNYLGNQDFQVFLDNTSLGTFKPASESYADFTTSAVTPGAGSHTLMFVGLNSAGGDTTAFIDNVRIINNSGATPVITSASSASGTAGAAFSYTITANNSPTSFNATGLPAGLSVDTTNGVISGTPTSAGTSSIALSATNAGGTGTAALALTINAAMPVITSTLTDSGTVGASFSYTITASNSPASFNATGLPAGLSVNTATGVISGTPTSAGTTSVTLSATNAGGTRTAALALTINAAKPVITSALTASGAVGSAFSYTITASNSPASFNATGLPAGLLVNTTTGVISGAPTVAGTSSVTLSATNAAGSGSATLFLTVNPASPAKPVITSTLDFSKGFAGSKGALTYNGTAKINGASAQLTDSGGNDAGSIFSTQAVDVTHFSCQFSFLLTNAKADGFTFTIQGNGPTALGTKGGGLGYAGIPKSMAIKFDLYNNNGEGVDSTGCT